RRIGPAAHGRRAGAAAPRPGPGARRRRRRLKPGGRAAGAGTSAPPPVPQGRRADNAPMPFSSSPRLAEDSLAPARPPAVSTCMDGLPLAERRRAMVVLVLGIALAVLDGT